MIANVKRVAATEFLEQRRQPWMIVAIIASLAFFPAALIAMVVAFDLLANSPQIGQQVAAMYPDYGHLGTEDGVRAVLGPSLVNIVVAMFSGPFGVVALSSAYSVLHDRNEGTLPFLMLAPLSRFELLLGKVLGAMVIPVLLHFTINGAASLIAGSFSITSDSAYLFAGTPAWWFAFLVNAPLGTLVMGALAVNFSALSSDARTSYQLINFVLALASIVLGGVVVLATEAGVIASIVLSVLLAGAAVATLAFGAALMSRDYVR